MSKKIAITALMTTLLFVGLFISACKPSASGRAVATDKSVYAPGETISVTFSTPTKLPDNAWIGIIPSNVPHGDEAQNDTYDLTYQYLNGMVSGTLAFTAPSTPGSYDVRMHDTDNNGKEIASVTFTVK